VSTPEPPPSSAAPSARRGEQLVLDPVQERDAKDARDRRHNVVDLPRFRAAGFLTLLFLVWANQTFVPSARAMPWPLERVEGPPIAIPFTSGLTLGPFAVLVAAYVSGSWWIIARWYRRDRPVHLGRLFLLLDLIVLGGAVWVTGGSQSWLFMLPYVRVFDQVHVGMRWCLTCTAAAVSTHAALILLEYSQLGAVPLEVELLKLVVCATLALYLTSTSRTAERLRRRNSRTVAFACDLVRVLEEQNTDLERARVEAESAAFAKSAFLATMSHEIRTPLNGVLGMLALAEETDLGADARECLDTARASAETLLQILGDVLDTSKIEAGQMHIESTVYAPSEVVRRAVALIESAALAKGLVVTTTIESDVPETLIGDPLRLGQILLNLLSNALKFTARGSIAIRLRFQSSAIQGDATGALCATVRDTGIGIDRAQQARVFEAFTQAEMTTSRRFGGTGLGLTISRRLAELMGGTLTVESQAGRGSTFTLTLPQVQPASEVATDPVGPLPRAATPVHAVESSGNASERWSPPSRPKSVRRSSHPLSILLAEDHPVNRRVAQQLLERWGHRVSVAVDGAEAVQMAIGQSFDCVLMDIQMPEVDGMEATRQLRALDSRAASGQRLPIIAMTANALSDDRDRYLASDMDGYIAKPIDIEQLFELLEGIGATAQAGSA